MNICTERSHTLIYFTLKDDHKKDLLCIQFRSARWSTIQLMPCYALYKVHEKIVNCKKMWFVSSRDDSLKAFVAQLEFPRMSIIVYVYFFLLYSLFFIIQHSPGRVLNSWEVAYMNGKFISFCFYTFKNNKILVLKIFSLLKFLLEK